MYVMIIIISCAVAEITFLVKYFTRFSEEIFTGVIALFFLVEAARHIAYVSGTACNITCIYIHVIYMYVTLILYNIPYSQKY